MPLALGLVLMSACGPAPPPPPPAPPEEEAPAAPRPDDDNLFADATAATGLDFVHFNGATGEYYFHEMMGAGVALFDYDGDGDLDIYLVQGHLLGPDKTLSDAILPPKSEPPFRDRLWRNDLVIDASGARRLHFTDVTATSGLDARGYGMGVATGDYDDDGDIDLYVTNFGANQLWRNEGNGTFTDATAISGTGDQRWSVAAAFFDYDRDGWLDLYVGNYVDFSVATHKRCTTELGAPNYCGPLAYAPQADALFRNRGDGTFEEVSARAGVGGAHGGALGVMPADFDGDGWLDLYVGNDGLPNQLWINQRDGTFRDEALLAGAAVNAAGQPEASMGIDAADCDGDGDEDLFITHLTRETNTLYRNDGRGLFEDVSARSGLGPPSLPFTAFGTGFFDAFNQGRLDLLVVNGAVKVIDELALARDPFPLHQPDQFFAAQGPCSYALTPAGAALDRSEVSRGAAFGDLDDDGDVDVVVTHNGGPARVLLNRRGQDRPWIGLRLVDGVGRDLLGARVGVFAEGRPPLWRRVRTAGSYASAQDPRVHVGLGDLAGSAVRVEVQWPDRRGPSVEAWPSVPVGRYSTLVRGTGEAPGSKP